MKKEKNIIFCSRDRFGVKPFYYTQVDNKFVFGSEIKQLLQFYSERYVNKKILMNYLVIGYENYNNEEIKDYHAVTEEIEIADDLSGIWIQVERLVGEKYTKIIKMYYEGKSFVEIAEEFGVSKQRVNSMFWNSIKKIQNNKKLFANFV